MDFEPTAAGERPAGREATDGEISFRRLLAQLGILLAGFAITAGLHMGFHRLIEDLDERTGTERARLFIAEEIARQVAGIQSDAYQMATVSSARGQDAVARQIGERLAGIEHALSVLRSGGEVRRVIHVDLGGTGEVVRAMRYSPPEGESAYVMELIDLAPKIEAIDRKLVELRNLLSLRGDGAGEGPGHQGLIELERAVRDFLKRLAPYFAGVKESASRALVEGHRRLADLEAQVEVQRNRYHLVETGLVLLITAALVVLSIVYARQVANSNARLRRAWADMRAAKEEAEQASRAKSQFLSRMSHELRTPLNAILGFAQLLQSRRSLEPEQHAQVAEIGKAGEHLLALVNDVLDLAKIEAGRITYERVPFDPLDIVDGVAATLAEQAYAKGLTVHAFASPALPPRVIGDPTRLRQVLMNLVSNALKFTVQGEVALRAEPSAEAGQVTFRVRDSGPGFDEETGRRLFRPFTQGDDSTSRRFGGSGLGLVICKELVHGMGGQIGFESHPGRGTTFWVTLPLESDPQAPARPTPLAGLDVLVLSADRPLTAAVTTHVVALGGRPSTAGGAAEALDRLQGPATVDLVLLDTSVGTLPAAVSRDLTARRTRCVLIARPGTHPREEEGWPVPCAVINPPVTYSRLSQAVTSALQGEVAPPPTRPSTGATLEGRVLLVEDNPVNQVLALEMLTYLGVVADSAQNGLEALERLRRERYDLVLMDVEMPEMDGCEATRRIRADEGRQGRGHVAIVAMTANAMSEDRERCLAAGMDDHLAKPVMLGQLEAVLRTRLPAGRGTEGVVRRLAG
jgi:signal transduction histidine kinase/CheY-like chemotaxis protein